MGWGGGEKKTKKDEEGEDTYIYSRKGSKKCYFLIFFSFLLSSPFSYIPLLSSPSQNQHVNGPMKAIQKKKSKRFFEPTRASRPVCLWVGHMLNYL